jgi:hypothetical protein
MATYPVINKEPGCGEIGEVYDKLKKSHPGWNDVLNKCSKAPGSTVKPV